MQTRKPSYAVAAGIIAVVLALMVGTLFWFLSQVFYEGVDFDPRLTARAREATPVIEAIAQFNSEKHAYPADLSEVRSYLAPADAVGLSSDASMFRGWYYSPFEVGAGYTIGAKLNWDATLIYEVTDQGARWIYGPGDGNPDRAILLKLD